MKKKLLFVLFFLFILFSSLNAQSFKSNSMGQNLGIDEGNSDYVLEVEDNISTLFHKNDKIRTYTTVIEGVNKTVTEVNLKDNSSVVKSYKDGFLINKKILSDSKSSEFSFNYNNGSLIFCVIKNNNEEPVTEYYLKDSVSGKLIGTKKFDDVNLSGNKYLIENETMFSQISDSFVVENEFSINEDGNISYKKGDNSYLYTSSGLILDSTEGNVNTKYTYDENNNLIQSEVISGLSKTINQYENNILTKGYVYENDQLKSILDFSNPDYGKIMTVYSDNKAIADVYYGTDNIKIMKIEYLD